MKGGRGAVAANLAAKIMLKGKGKYIVQITDKLTPVIGSVQTPFVLTTAAGGYLTIGTGLGETLLVAPFYVRPRDTSLLLAYRYILPTATGSLGLGFSTDQTNGLMANASDGANISTITYAQANLMAFVGSLVAPAASATEHTFVVAYDAVTNIVTAWIDGVQSAAGTPVEMNAININVGGILISSLLGGEKYRDIHAIVFENKGLPTNMSALVTDYINNPLQKLSRWAN